jgi:hypothetical protein
MHFAWFARAHKSLSAVSLGKPLTFGGFAVRQLTSKGKLCRSLLMVSRISRLRFITDWHCHNDTSARRRFKRALEQHMKHLPAGALVVVIDDGSKPAAVVPDGVQLLRHETSLGIVASKNASLSALMDAGCEHLFYGMMMPGPSLITGTSLTSNHQSRTWLTSFSIWLAAIS